QPFKFSNYGGEYQSKGVMANGENILGAQPGTEEPIKEKGTSCAAPIVTGISALLMSLQLQRGEQPNAEAVREAILNSAIPCNPEEVEEPERCLLGKLNIPGAFQLLTGERLTSEYVQLSHPEINFRANSKSPLKRTENNVMLLETPPNINVSKQVEKSLVANSINSRLEQNLTINQEINYSADSITPSAASKLVYALGTIGYDFGDEARRDSFKQLMPAVNIDGAIIPANPYD
ncbi:MAG: S8 family serine peptidase, partial [Dolichospermum sp.]